MHNKLRVPLILFFLSKTKILFIYLYLEYIKKNIGIPQKKKTNKLTKHVRNY